MIRRNAKIVLMAIAAQVAVATVELWVLSSNWGWSSDALWYVTRFLSHLACVAITAVALMKVTQTRWRTRLLAAVAIGISLSVYWIGYTSPSASFAATDLVSFTIPVLAISMANSYARGRVTLWELLCIPLASIAIAAPCTIAYEMAQFTEWSEALTKSTARQIWFTNCLHWSLLTTGCCVVLPLCLAAASGRRRILSAVALFAVAFSYPLFVAYGLTALARHSILHDKPFRRWTGDELLTILKSPPSTELLLQALENDPWSRLLGRDGWLRDGWFGDDWRIVYVKRLAELPDQSSFNALVRYFVGTPNPVLAECIAQACTPERGIETSPLLLRYSYRACIVPRTDAFDRALLRMKIPHGASPIIWLQTADGVPTDQLSLGQRDFLLALLHHDGGDRRDDWRPLVAAPKWRRPERIPEKVWQQLNAEMEAGSELLKALEQPAYSDPDGRVTLRVWRSIDWNAKSTDDFIQSIRASFAAAQQPEKP